MATDTTKYGDISHLEMMIKCVTKCRDSAKSPIRRAREQEILDMLHKDLRALRQRYGLPEEAPEEAPEKGTPVALPNKRGGGKRKGKAVPASNPRSLFD